MREEAQGRSAMEQTGGDGRRVGGSGGGGEGGFDRAYSVGGGRGSGVKGKEGGGVNCGDSSSGGASAKQQVSHGGKKEVEGEAGGGKSGDQLVPAIPYTRPLPLVRQARVSIKSQKGSTFVVNH